jgi:hypothetical protein
MLTASLSGVLGAAGWWWITWPERTAETFVRLMNEKKWEEASKLTVTQADHDWMVFRGFEGIDKAEWRKFEVVPTRRSWSDFLSGRQEFAGHAPYSVARGKVRLNLAN